MTPDAAAHALLVTLTDAPLEGIWSAPGRANLIGEHTDYNDGFVLPFAIHHRTAAAVARRTDNHIRVASTFAEAPVAVNLDDLDHLFPTRPETKTVPEWAAYPLGVAWAIRQAAFDGSAGAGASGTEGPHGLDIAFASTVPVGAGLSSSAAIESATAVALNDLWNLGLDRIALAQAGRRAENEAVGAPTGIMDQMASLLGQPDAALFLDCRSLNTRTVPLGLADAGLALLVIDTQVKHSHATGGYGERRASCEKGAAALGVAMLRDLSIDDLPRAHTLLDDETFRRVRHVVTENARVLDTVKALTTHGPRTIGKLLTASHASMRDDFEISCPELDLAVDTALAAGALGARMTGGGFGGAAIALIEQEDLKSVSEQVFHAFTTAGFTAPHLFTITASAGANRHT